MSKKMIICMLLDESGSMSTNKQAALAGVNEYIESIKADYERDPSLGDIYFTFVTFSSSYSNTGDDVRFKYNLRHITEVEKIPSSEYVPNGGTPLLQAIGRTMESLDAVDNKDSNPLMAFLEKSDIDDSKIVMVIQTDGEETEWSKVYTKEKISQMIKEREDAGNWTFVFLGAGIDAVSEGMKIGLAANSSYSMDASVPVSIAYGATYTGSALATSKLRSSPAMRSTSYVEDMKSEIEKLKEKKKK